MVKVKPERTADCVVAGFRVADVGVTSLVLGVYDAEGVLRHVGVTSSFTRQDRRALVGKLEPHAVPLSGHPWEHGFAIERRPMGRLRGAAGLWTPEMPQDWVPVDPALVCEVAYSQLDVDRFRHPAQFRRWRPDRAPRSCTFEQFEAESPAELVAV
jgi:ATP-dependent DNA ligase